MPRAPAAGTLHTVSMLRDLHSHSSRSDGLLSPSELVRRAAARGVDVLALTDHDELAGIAEARDTALDCGVALVAGCELSVTWQATTIHVVALGIDVDDAALCEGLAGIRAGRDARARRIAESLAEVGIPGAFEGARKYVTSERLISRTHFARYLVEAGYAVDVHDVFRHYLTPGKPGYVPHQWAGLSQALDWIHGASGQAVLAHPARYRLTPGELRRLLGEFHELSGDGLEVMSPQNTPTQVAELATLARVFGLLASTGSDFHGPRESRVDVGGLEPLPAGTAPIWSVW